MSSLVFDTHQAVKNLKSAGADEKLAEAVVTTIGTAISDHVATKADIKDVRAEIKDVRGEIKAVRGEIKTVWGEIKTVRGEIKDVRADIEALHLATKAAQDGIEALRLATKADIEHLKKDLTIRLGVMLFAGFGAMTAILEVLR